MRLNNANSARNLPIEVYKFLNSRDIDNTSDNDSLFYWEAARNCVEFHLKSRQFNLNRPKYNAFKGFLSLPIEKASKSNVWRWYFATGGHPPYDPSKRY